MTEASSPVNLHLSDYLFSQRLKFEQSLREYCQSGTFGSLSEVVVEAAHYSLFLPSKRLRPLFCLEICKALGGNDWRALPAAVALEMVHTYSLIHDDLPAMDNDDLRRGKPTNHKVYGEAMAILAGDGLLTQAFLALVGEESTSSRVKASWVKELSEASGLKGMVLGQAWDMSHQREASVVALENLHRRKTGALLAASCAMGAISAEADDGIVASIRQFGSDMGLAFQIRDDVLDVEGGADLGKPLMSDEKNNKPTYVSVLGLTEAKKQADEWAQKALRQIRSIPFPFENRLEEMTMFVIERKI